MVDLNTCSLEDLYAELSRTGLVRRLVELARDEDLGERGGPGTGDITSAVALPDGSQGGAAIVCRGAGVVAGLAVIPEILLAFAPGVVFTPLWTDGKRARAGEVLGRLDGPLRQVLAAERTILNFVGRLSGVATRTAAFVEAIGTGARAKLYDTRKTTPGLRVLEKYAVRCGGGMCHRIGLHDAVLIKDNHLAGVGLEELTGFIADAARRARALRGPAGLGGGEDGLRSVEVEVDSLDQLERVLAVDRGLVDMVLLDNMDLASLRRAVARRDRAGATLELEASGGVRLSTVRAIAETGVDRISAGSVTHGAVWLDVALDIAGPEGRAKSHGGPIT